MKRVYGRRWNLVLDDGVLVKLPETDWAEELNTLERLIVDNGVLEATQTVDFYDRLARAATRITVNAGEKKTVALDVMKVIK